MSLEKAKYGLVLKCTKVKDAAPFEPLHLRLVEYHDSMVIEEKTAAAKHPQLETLLVLVRTQDGLTSTQWQADSGRANTTFSRQLKLLQQDGLVEGGGARGEPYLVTEVGRDALEAAGLLESLVELSHSPSSLPPNALPFRGAWDGSERKAGNDGGLETGLL
jgi:hypothetical protein